MLRIKIKLLVFMKTETVELWQGGEVSDLGQRSSDIKGEDLGVVDVSEVRIFRKLDAATQLRRRRGHIDFDVCNNVMKHEKKYTSGSLQVKTPVSRQNISQIYTVA